MIPPVTSRTSNTIRRISQRDIGTSFRLLIAARSLRSRNTGYTSRRSPDRPDLPSSPQPSRCQGAPDISTGSMVGATLASCAGRAEGVLRVAGRDCFGCSALVAGRDRRCLMRTFRPVPASGSLAGHDRRVVSQQPCSTRRPIAARNVGVRGRRPSVPAVPRHSTASREWQGCGSSERLVLISDDCSESRLWGQTGMRPDNWGGSERERYDELKPHGRRSRGLGRAVADESRARRRWRRFGQSGQAHNVDLPDHERRRLRPGAPSTDRRVSRETMGEYERAPG